jgi:hypothetical protein
MVTSSQRTSLLEKYSYINVEHDTWWDCVYSDFTEDMKAVGIEVHRMFFSGFWSQGDGACFVGKLDNPQVYLDHHHKDQYPMIRKLLENGGSIYTNCEQRGNYYHENSVRLWIDRDPLHAVIDQPTEFHVAIVEEWDKLLDAEMTDFDTTMTEQWRTYMRDLYRKLEAEYDCLTSEDAIWDTIVANELDTDADTHDTEELNYAA